MLVAFRGSSGQIERQTELNFVTWTTFETFLECVYYYIEKQCETRVVRRAFLTQDASQFDGCDDSVVDCHGVQERCLQRGQRRKTQKIKGIDTKCLPLSMVARITFDPK